MSELYDPTIKYTQTASVAGTTASYITFLVLLQVLLIAIPIMILTINFVQITLLLFLDLKAVHVWTLMILVM